MTTTTATTGPGPALSRHRALAACSPAALKVWHAILAFTEEDQDVTLSAIVDLTRLHPRTVTKAREELRRRGLLPSPEESASRARVARVARGIDLTDGSATEVIDRVLVALGEAPTNHYDRQQIRRVVALYGVDATIVGVLEALGVPGLGSDRWRLARQYAAKESRSRGA